MTHPRNTNSGLVRTAQELEHLERLHLRIGNIQIGLAALAVAGAVLALGWKAFSILWVLVPIVAIVVLAVVHERVLGRRTRSRRVVAFYEHALERVQDRWAGKGETGDRFLDPLHPYAKDLDLFGQGSLFEYLSTARTRGGEETLARWLLSPSEPEDLKIRHEAVRELASELDLREQLAVLGEDIRVGVNPEALAAWGRSRRGWFRAGAGSARVFSPCWGSAPSRFGSAPEWPRLSW